MTTTERLSESQPTCQCGATQPASIAPPAGATYRDLRWTAEQMSPFGVMITANHYTTDVDRVPINVLRSLVRQHGLVVLRRFQTFSSAKSFENFGHRLGAPVAGRFGMVTERVERRDGGSPAATVTRPSLFRWDGMYGSHIPELQVSHCVTAPGGDDSGRSVFVDTTKLLAAAGPALRSAWARIVLTYRSTGIGDNNGIARSPLVVPHPTQRYPVIRFAECGDDDESVVRHVDRRMSGGSAAKLDYALDALRSRLESPTFEYRHRWEIGDVVIANNYMVLHRRVLFPCSPSRRVQQLRVLGNPPCRNRARM